MSVQLGNMAHRCIVFCFGAPTIGACADTNANIGRLYGQAHDFGLKNAETTEIIMSWKITTAFLEDQAIFEAQQANMLAVPNAPQVDINADNGVIQTRLVLDRLVQEEQAGRQVAVE